MEIFHIFPYISIYFLSSQYMVSVLLVEYSIHPTQAIPTLVQDMKQYYFMENYIFFQLFVNFSPYHHIHHFSEPHKVEDG